MGKENMQDAKEAKQDEFYTQFKDIENEINAYLDRNDDVFRGKVLLLPCDDPDWSSFTRYFAKNFKRLGLKKLISTSYAPNSKPKEIPYLPALFELESPLFDEEKTYSRGKIFTLTGDTNADEQINEEDLEWSYLEGDGDFRSEEVTALRDEADIIITNPPFSLFRAYLAWVIESGCLFSLIANKSCISYKEVFPLIRSNQMWPGSTPMGKDLLFKVPPVIAERLVADGKEGSKWKRVDGEVMGRSASVWFTNIEHNRRHEPISLMTQDENIKHSSHDEVRGVGYKTYDNYEAIEVPYTDAIPSDYGGIMGVPISFLGRYSPEQFEVLGMAASAGYDQEIVGIPFIGQKDARPLVGGINTFARVFIKHRGF